MAISLLALASCWIGMLGKTQLLSSPHVAWQKFRKGFASQQKEAWQQSWQGPLDTLENFLERT